jgi:hypothetical protein
MSTEDIQMEEYLVSMLPDYITTSDHFKDWRELFPSETVFPVIKNNFVETLRIHSQADLDKILKAEHEYGFTPQVKQAIFAEIDRYWNDSVCSEPITLPEKDMSWFANQVLLMFKETDEMALVACMKHGYLDLFNYIYDKNGSNILQSGGSFNIYSLLTYAVINNNVDMIRRGIQVGCPVTDSLLKPTMETKNPEIFNILLENRLVISSAGEKDICEYATPQMFKMFLEIYINRSNNDPAKLIVSCIKNLDNLKDLLLNYDVSTAKEEWGYKFVCMLFKECITQSLNVDTLIFIEDYFAAPLKEFKEYNETNGFEFIKTNCICDSVMWNDNLGLYLKLHDAGFVAHDNLLYISRKLRRCHRITPGLIKKHIAEYNQFKMNKLKMNQ